MEFLIDLAAVALVLGVLVFVHEFGHYAVAKLCGVRVEVFSLGFGKRIWGFRRGDTDYRVSVLPLGGYVKMAGENPLESRTGDPGEFTSHPRWQRFLIAIAGPAMNITLALVVLTGIYMFHYEHPAYLEKAADIGNVDKDSPAAKAGIQPGDRIVQIQDVKNPTWEQVYPEVILNPNQLINVTIQRGGQILQKQVRPQPSGPDRLGDVGWDPHELVIGTLDPGHPAAKAGLKVGDEIVALNGASTRTIQDLINKLQEVKNNPVEITVLRDGQQFKLSVTPEFTDIGGDKKYRIGISGMHVDRLPFAQAVARSVESCKSNSMLVFQLVGKMIQKKVSPRQVSGPIGIARISGEAAMQRGWSPLLTVMAIISLQLAIFNLFPIPILDGGLMLMLVIEGIMRRDIKQEVKERVYQAAFVFLVLFAVVVIFNDVAKTFPGL
jgi:regulator of sigma E protease